MVVVPANAAARLDPPDLARWPDVHWAPAPTSKRVDVDRLTGEEVASWKPGDTLLLGAKPFDDFATAIDAELTRLNIPIPTKTVSD